jgi:hypothetical protein
MIRHGPRVPRLHPADPRVAESKKFIAGKLAEYERRRIARERKDHRRLKLIEKSTSKGN